MIYSHTQAIPAHNLHLDFVTAWAWHGYPSTIVYPPVTYRGNGVFTLTEYDRFMGNPHAVHFVFHLKWVNETIANKHVTMDFEHYSLAKGGARFNDYGSPHYCNYVIYDSWLMENGQITGIPQGSALTYNGRTYEQFAYTYYNAPIQGFENRYNYQRQEESLSILGGYVLGTTPDPNPPQGMTWVKKTDYYLEFIIAYVDFYTAGATAIFQIHNIKYVDPLGVDPPVTILPTQKGW